MDLQRHLVVSLCLVLLSLALIVNAQEARKCDTSGLTNRTVFQETLEGGIRSGDGSVTFSVVIFDMQIVCLAAADVRDLYRGASVVVHYNCSAILSSSSVFGGPCGMNGNPLNYTSQIDLECTTDLEWVPVPSTLSDPALVVIADANLDTPTDTFCSFCIDPEGDQIGLSNIDPVTHCAPCHSSCRDTDALRLCYGTGEQQCCDYYDGDSCVVNCDGTNRKPNSTFECEDVCEPLVVPVNGMIEFEPDGFHFLDTVATTSCNEGYELIDGSNQTCRAGGAEGALEWDPTVQPNCTIVDCGNLNAPHNGSVDTSSGTTFGSVATYSCSDFFDLMGDVERTCQAGGWNGMAPTCVKVCVPPCVNGICTNGTCDCEPFFTGDDCSECNCKNDGICMDETCVCPEPSAQFFSVDCIPCSEQYGEDCMECNVTHCTLCRDGKPPGKDGKCSGGSGQSSSDGGCDAGCIAGIIIAAIILALILAAIVAAIIYGIYKNRNAPTKLKKTDADGLNGVARDNPLYVDPSTVEEDIAATDTPATEP